MLASRNTLFALALGLMTSSAALAQTKTTTTTTKKPATKTPTKTTTKSTTTKSTTTKSTTSTPKPTTAAPAAPTTPPAPAVAPLTAEEATAGIKEALTVAIKRGFEAGGEPDGFNANPDIRLAFPPEAELVATTLRGLRMGTVIDRFEVLLNRSAEAVALQAGPIYTNALQRLALADALALVNTRESRAAAQLLREQTQEQVQQELKPLVAAALEQTGAKQLYGELMLRYRKVPLVTPITTDLTTYATGKTADGLYTLIADEESRIRMNSSARTSETLRRVFAPRR
jgi:hypothetical protein